MRHGSSTVVAVPDGIGMGTIWHESEDNDRKDELNSRMMDELVKELLTPL